jgi:hypothetical protein
VEKIGGSIQVKDRIALLGMIGLAVAGTAGWVRQPNVTPAVPVATNTLFDQPLTSTHASTERPFRVTAAQRQPVQIARADQGYERARVADDDRPVMVEKQRSNKASAAIIGGSAAAGAAIGGLAGGGKGAVIGAVAGGAGGLVYDRMTHKKTVPAEEVIRDEEGLRRDTRPTATSAAIIGGSAAAGAAIGAATGGGKGAAIGAIAGGTGGLIYDRITRTK